MHLLNRYALSCGVYIDEPFVNESYYPLAVDKYIVFQTSGKGNSRQYDYWTKVFTHIKEYTTDYKIIHVGIESDQSVNSVDMDLRGKTSLSQLAYLIKNSSLYLGIDSLSAHFAGHYNKKIVAMYPYCYAQNCKPFWGDPEHQTLLEVDWKAHGKPSFSLTEEKKKINTFMPEVVAKAALDQLGIENDLDKVKTLHIGDLYHKPMIEIVPDSLMAPAVIKDKICNIRMDYYYSESNLVRLASISFLNIITNKEIPLAILGEGVADKLSVNFDNAIQPLNIYFPNKNNLDNTLDLSSAFTFENISIGGTFSIQQEFDSKFIIVPKSYLDSALQLQQECTAIEILLDEPSKLSKIKSEIQALLGPSFQVKDSEEQHEFIYKIMKAEKWAVFIILLFILMIATFNLTGALTMLIIDKQHDIFIMKSFGLMTKRLKRIFILNGMLITITGVLCGLFLGLAICYSQIYFGWLTFSGQGSFVVDAYPVQINFLDVLLIAATVLLVGFVASIIPVNRIFRENKFNTVQQSI